MNPSRITVGLGNDTRTLYKVMQPPGGNTSDIFAAPEDVPQETSTPRRMKNHMASAIFGTDESPTNGTQTPTRTRPHDGSFDRLFGGEPQSVTKSPKKYMNSSISLDEGTPNGVANGQANLTNGHQKKYTPRNPVTGEGHRSYDCHPGIRKQVANGNPLTGEGYTNGTGDKKDDANGNKSRVPPGGFSSKLW